VYVTRLFAPTVGVLLVAGAAGATSGGTRLKASSISAEVRPFFSKKARLAVSADPRTCVCKGGDTAVAESETSLEQRDA